jgi:ribosomal protein S18 acetylase RimI-like enzyme
VNIRPLKPADLEPAGALLFQMFQRAASAHGYHAPWADEAEARSLLAHYYEAAPTLSLVAEEGGAVIGVGTARVRGEVASIGPIAAYVEGHGVGGALLDRLLEGADEAGAGATRLYVDAWNPPAFALYAGRGFGVVDVVAHVERKPAPGPALHSARGLEVRAFEAGDLEELARLDLKLTGHERARDLADMVRVVARRHNAIVGYLGAQQTASMTRLGPAVAVDVSDLFTLITTALAASEQGESWIQADKPLVARLSTAAPAASLAAIGMGFRIRELGVLMSRGAPPPTRPAQLYSIVPEVL